MKTTLNFAGILVIMFCPLLPLITAAFSADNIDHLVGAVDCNNCKDVNELIYECLHYTQNIEPPNSPCDTNGCIKNKLYWWECEETTGTADCNKTYHPTVEWVHQWAWKSVGNPNYCGSDDDGTGGFHDWCPEEDCISNQRSRPVKCLTSTRCNESGTLIFNNGRDGLWKCQ